MKKKLLSIIVLFSISAFSQVGINNKHPRSTLDVLGKNNTSIMRLSDSSLETRIEVDKDGNLIINEADLTINNTTGVLTGLKLPNGASYGLKLLSDEEGNTFWGTDNVIIGTVPAGPGINIANYSTQYYTNAHITLPKGKWAINFGAYMQLYHYDGVNFKLTSSTTVISTDSQIWSAYSLSSTANKFTELQTVTATKSGLIPGLGKASAGVLARGMRSALSQGSILIEVIGETPETFYVFVTTNNYGEPLVDLRPGNMFGTGWERWLYAIPL